MTAERESEEARAAQLLRDHRQVTGLLAPVVLALLLAGVVALGILQRSGLLLAQAGHLLLLLGLTLGVRRSLTLRLRGLQSARKGMALWRVALGVLLINGAGALLRWPLPEATLSSGLSLLLAVGAMLLAFGGIVLARYYAASDEQVLPDAHGLSACFRVQTWVASLVGLCLLLRAMSRPLWETQLTRLLVVLLVVFAAELLLRGLASLFARRPAEGPSIFGAELLSTSLLGSAFNPVESLFTAMERGFGVDLRDTWALRFLRQALLPVAALMLLVAWLMTALVAVDSAEQALVERFGRPLDGEPLGPGLHLVLPWPADRVRRVATARVRTMPVGYVEAKAGASALWTKYHAAEEYNLLLGNGRDLVTVNADLHYQVGDIRAYLYGSQNPDTALEVIAYEVLLDHTVGRSLDGVLSENLGALAESVAATIQRRADQRRLGMHIVAFTLRGLHPPVRVATEYQAVVSAQVDKGTYIIEAQAYREEAIPRAQAEAVRIENRARAEKATRLAEAKGEAIAFGTLESSYRASPDLYRFRRRMETLEQSLQDLPLWVVDRRIERDGGDLWILD